MNTIKFLTLSKLKNSLTGQKVIINKCSLSTLTRCSTSFSHKTLRSTNYFVKPQLKSEIVRMCSHRKSRSNPNFQALQNLMSTSGKRIKSNEVSWQSSHKPNHLRCIYPLFGNLSKNSPHNSTYLMRSTTRGLLQKMKLRVPG